MDRMSGALGEGYRLLRSGAYGDDVTEMAKRVVYWAELMDLNAEPGRASTFVASLGPDVDPKSIPEDGGLLDPACRVSFSAAPTRGGQGARLKVRLDTLKLKGA